MGLTSIIIIVVLAIVLIIQLAIIWYKYKKTGKFQVTTGQKDFFRALFEAAYHTIDGNKEEALKHLENRYLRREFDPMLEENKEFLEEIAKSPGNPFTKKDLKGVSNASKPR